MPVTCSYPKPDQSSPCPPSHFLKIRLNIILPSTPGSSNWSQAYPTKTLYTPLLTCYFTHFIILYRWWWWWWWCCTWIVLTVLNKYYWQENIYKTYASPIPNPTFRNYRAISCTVYKLDVLSYDSGLSTNKMANRKRSRNIFWINWPFYLIKYGGSLFEFNKLK